MKILLISIYFFSCISISNASEIDDLTTPGQVLKFIDTKILPKGEGFRYSYDDSSYFGKNKFLKLDLDNNGYTDLLVRGFSILIILDNKEHKYQLCQAKKYGDDPFQNNQLKDIISLTDTPVLIFDKSIDEYTRTMNGVLTENKFLGRDSLIIKFGQLIEYNSSPDNFQIENIKLSTTVCEGTCPEFKLSINSQRNAEYSAIEYNDLKGNFKAKVDKESYNRLISTINYIKLNTLKKRYSVGVTDFPTYYLEIIYNNGNKKLIEDYGGDGTYGLKNLYSQLFKLRKNLNWK